MAETNDFLKKCQELRELGLEPEFEAGARIARGFADLGFEEFVMISQARMVSLYTGQQSDLNPDHRRFFFSVPSPDDLTDRINRMFYDIESIEFQDQRAWRIKLKEIRSGAVIECLSPGLHEVFVDGFAAVLKSVREGGSGV